MKKTTTRKADLPVALTLKDVKTTAINILTVCVTEGPELANWTLVWFHIGC